MTKNRNPGSGIGEQGLETRDLDTERLKQLLRSAISPLGDDPEPGHDLWPAMLRRFDEESAHRANKVPWFDWALAGGLVVFAAIAPRTIPVIFYYL